MSPTKSSPRRQFQTTASNTNDNVTLSSPLKKTQTLASTLSKKDYFSTKYVASSSLVEPSLYKQIENPDVNTQAAQNTNFLSQNTNSTYDSSIPSDYEWEDPRPESPLKYNELISEDSDDDHDPLYKPDSGVLFHDSEDDDLNYEGEEGLNLEFEEGEEEEENVIEGTDFIENESDESDDELRVARERVKFCNVRLLEIANQVEREAKEGKLGAQSSQPTETTPSQSGYLSEYEDSEDDIHTPPDSGDEFQERRKGNRGSLVSSNTDFSVFKWKVGQRFPNRGEFKAAVAKYGIVQGRNVYFVLSNKNRREELGVKCIKGCPFYLYGSWHSKLGTFLVKRVKENHTCHRNMKRNRQLKSSWVAREMLEVFKARPHWPAKEIMEAVRIAYKALIKRHFAYRVKYRAHQLLHGSMKEHYLKVGRYMEAIKASSPGNVMELRVDKTKKVDPPTFQRFFVCFDGLKQGWKEGCRKVICVDAAFLKTFLGGQILSAVGRDGNDQMYPIAWAAVEGENNLSWEWFFTHLQSCLDLGDGTDIAMISDEHQAILHAVSTILPKAEHRHCARHIFALWHKTYKGDEFKLVFWKVAKAYNMADYNEALDELTTLSEDAATAFKSYNPKVFCRAYLNSSIKTDAITNNMAETFNGYIINARTKHLIYMLEDIRVALMQRLVCKKKGIQKTPSLLCPRIQAKLEKEKTKAANCEVLPSTDNLFNVRYYLDQLNVDLDAKSCTCRKWDMLGIPCCHAIACIFFLNKEAESFVDASYKKEMYLKAYGGSIPPLEGERHWPRALCIIDPPPIKIGPGRPRIKRFKGPSENPKKPGTLSRVGMEMTCSICQTKGHNKRRCPNRDNPVIREPTSKRPRGRPKKDNSATNNQSASNMISTTVTAQPSQLGRNGRLILGGLGARDGSQIVGKGRGSRGRGQGDDVGAFGRGSSGRGQGGGCAATGRGKGKGRGRGKGKNQVPVGVGVYIGADGTPFSNVS
ncbi:uncharacterized protein [Spinacia oleracea]|uniref:SWIM-type domain-containing protein n=1 Tax=Spinacia oleracea TaxID=3562 RepID=A0ABM3RGJ0_SPIOL|nr:uncharacterized protein LOC110779032 [Spinacia oleracea]